MPVDLRSLSGGLLDSNIRGDQWEGDILMHLLEFLLSLCKSLQSIGISCIAISAVKCSQSLLPFQNYRTANISPLFL